MRYPYNDKAPGMEGYFPERDALQHELNKLNQVIKSQRTSEVWKKFFLSTSNDEYGGVHNLSRKERERGPFFDPWYRSSNEIGKYFRPLPRKEQQKIQDMLSEQKTKQERVEEKPAHPKADRSISEINAVSLPEIDNRHQVTRHSEPAEGVETWQKPRRNRDAPMNYQNTRHELRTGPAKNFMTNPMGRLWQNMNEIPGETGRNKRVSPKKRSPVDGGQKVTGKREEVKLPAVDRTLRYGVGKSTGVPKCSNADVFKEMSIPSLDSKGSSLN